MSSAALAVAAHPLAALSSVFLLPFHTMCMQSQICPYICRLGTILSGRPGACSMRFLQLVEKALQMPRRNQRVSTTLMAPDLRASTKSSGTIKIQKQSSRNNEHIVRNKKLSLSVIVMMSRKRFAGFTSEWISDRSWQYRSADTRCLVQRLMLNTFSIP